jgi:demethylmenaquinone methyltransferase/2-methoxy-6-polyprenyl-1,4-benzoquinol methylase
MYDARDFFNKKASVWDSKTQHDPENIKTVLRLSDLAKGCCVLDVGCGTGVLEGHLIEYEPGVVLAIDFAENMINVAREKLSHPAVQFVCADYFDVKALTFDNVFFINTFPHFSEPKRAVKHLLGLLKSGGRVTISHVQGKAGDGTGIISPMLPAQGLLNLLRPYFRLDVMVDNSVLFMISGIRI